MPDFSKLAKRTAGVAVRPKALPVSAGDDYPGIVKRFELLDAPPERNYTQIVRVHLGLTDWPDAGVEEDEREEEYEEGKTRPIDLSKRQLRKDFYDNSLYILDEFIRSCGIELD